MGSEITLVSAFFNIGRGNLEDQSLARSVEQYFNYFKAWARMRNQLIIYTEPKYVDKVVGIRNEFGLHDRTVVIAVEDIYRIEPEMYAKMKEISENERFCNYRFDAHAMSNRADYDYVMLLKYWCLMDASKRGYIPRMAAWIDFGFNHGEDLYHVPEEFDFEWNYSFSDKIQLFALKNPDKELGLRNLQLQTDCIMGCLLLAPGRLCKEFWEMIKNSMKALFLLDSIDDDQQLLLMAYRMNPELFEIHISTWFMPLKENGGEHLSVKAQTTEPVSAIERGKQKVREILKRTPDARFLKRLSQDMVR
jgi:protein YibB